MNSNKFSTDAYPKLNSCAKYIVDNIDDLLNNSAKSNNFSIGNWDPYLSNKDNFTFNNTLIKFFKQISEGNNFEDVKKKSSIITKY